MATTQSRFNDFVAAADVGDTVAAFEQLRLHDQLPLSDNPKSSFFERIRAGVLPNVIYRQKGYFALLDSKIAAAQSVCFGDFVPKRFLISGAGPCGLRAAVELAAMGHDVSIIELRNQFSRHNIIKTWKSTIADLTPLGLSLFIPTFQPHGHLHLETRHIQLVLLKTALMLGVNVRYDTGVCGLGDPASSLTPGGKFAAWTLPAAEARAFCRARSTVPESDALPAELSLQVNPDLDAAAERRNKVDFIQHALSSDGAVISDGGMLDPRAELIEFDALFVAEGEASTLMRHLGFDRKYARFAEAIGLIINLEFSPAVASAKRGARAPELMTPEFVIGRTEALWRAGILGDLDRAGVQVENIEYMRGIRTHFLVVTVKRASLLAANVLRTDLGAIRDTLTASNVDIGELRKFSRSIASAAGVPEDAPFCDRHGVQLFDFSSKGMAMQTTRVLESANRTKAVVFPIGDAYQNPFWPQGLGINRGFQTTLDAVHAAHLFFAASPEIALHERAFSRRTAEWRTLSDEGLNTPTTAVPWTADPVSRYSANTYKQIHLHDMADPSLLLGRASFWENVTMPAFCDGEGQAAAAARISMPQRIMEHFKLEDLRGKEIVSPGR
ncbi:[F-actin]-monooxygenase mical3 [Geranomyces michiganensis]|nr:[F-actin]-monooxygenase mical3 [Geranomyces michiganensis]